MLFPLVEPERSWSFSHARGWITKAQPTWESRKWLRIHTFIVFVFFWCLPAHANTVTAASCSLSDVQTAVNSSANGGTVLVPTATSCPGGVSWGGGTLNISNAHGITLNGQGMTETGSSHISFVANATSTTRVTGFTFIGIWACCGNWAIRADGSTSTTPFRIDHNTITGSPGTGSQTLVEFDDNAPGVFDHNTLSAPDNSEIIHNFGMGSSSNAGWQDDIVPGGSNMVFIETNTISNNTSSSNFNGCSAVQSYYGARTVIRYNTIYFCQVDQHGTAGNIGARWWEIYQNTFQLPSGGGNQCCYTQLRDGSGVVFSNHKTGGTNTGGGAIQICAAECGTALSPWPVAWQVGSGINGYTNGHNSCANGTLNSAPAWAWGNDSSMPVSGDGTNVQLNRDFFVSASQPASMNWQEQSGDTCSTTYTYTPYTYPHPLTGTTSSGPAPPLGLTVSVQ